MQFQIIYNSEYVSTYIKSKRIEAPIKNKKIFKLDKNISSLTTRCWQKVYRKQKDTERLKLKGE